MVKSTSPSRIFATVAVLVAAGWWAVSEFMALQRASRRAR
jgi:hypothetical protein